LTVTPGNETDFAQIEDDIRDFCRRFRVQSVAYDPWGSTQLAQRLLGEGAPMVEFRATRRTSPSRRRSLTRRSDRGG
jgi:phage terminase large subunit-like protein